MVTVFPETELVPVQLKKAKKRASLKQNINTITSQPYML